MPGSGRKASARAAPAPATCGRRGPFPSALGLLAGVAALLLGPGCVSADLSKNDAVTKEVVECLPTDAPAPAVIESAVWFPNASGFASAGSSAMGHVSGVLALAGDRLWFMSWNEPEHHYDMDHVVSVVTAASVSIDRVGPSALLVVQSRNLSYDSYELMSGGGLGSDPKATDALYQQLQELRRMNPQTEP